MLNEIKKILSHIQEQRTIKENITIHGNYTDKVVEGVYNDADQNIL